MIQGLKFCRFRKIYRFRSNTARKLFFEGFKLEGMSVSVYVCV